MNLCPCGGRGDPARECTCSAQRLAAFREKLSRALLDRFDLVVALPRPRAAELAARRGSLGAVASASRGCGRAAVCAATAPSERMLRRALDARGRAAAALGPWPRAGGARSPDDRGAGGRRRGHTRSMWPRRSPTVAARARDSEARTLARRAISRRCCRRSHDPPRVALPARLGEPELLGAAGGRRRRRTFVLAVRRPGRAHARPRAGRCRARRRQRARARHRRRGASRRARERAAAPSQCSAAGSTATTRPRTHSSRGGSRTAGSSSPSTSRESSPRRGGSRRGIGSSPASAKRPWSSRRASEAAR